MRATLSPSRSTRTITLLALACASWGLVLALGLIVQAVLS